MNLVNVRLIIIAALFAIIIAFLVGVLSSVPFLEILFRAFIGGILFAILGGGIYFVIEKYIPELLSANRNNGKDNNVRNKDADNIEDTNDNRDGEVDIILPEENPHVNEEDVDVLEGMPENTSAKLNKEEISEEFEEEYSTEEKSGEVEKTDDIPEETDEMKSAGAFELDALPNIDSLGSITENSNMNKGDNVIEQTSKNINISGTEQNPEDAAKAIKTWLNKDKEGK